MFFGFGQSNPNGLNNFLNFTPGSAMASFSQPYPGYPVSQLGQNTQADAILGDLLKSQRKLAKYGNGGKAAAVDFSQVVASLYGADGQWDSASSLRLTRKLMKQSTNRLKSSHDAARRAESSKIAMLNKKILEERLANAKNGGLDAMA